jgi:hypothetical protein
MFFIPIVTVATIVLLGAVFSAYYRWRNKTKVIDKVVELAKKEVDKDKSVMTYVDYKGFRLPMTVHEKKNIWNNLTTAGKKAALSDWKKHLKK